MGREVTEGGAGLALGSESLWGGRTFCPSRVHMYIHRQLLGPPSNWLMTWKKSPALSEPQSPFVQNGELVLSHQLVIGEERLCQ